ncbi:MAG: hypothetical protein WCP96_08465 [Methylococcaceae bacterium]
MQEKRQTAYAKAIELAEKAITLYDSFSYLYRCVISELNVFDAKGCLRNRQQAEAGVNIGLTLIDELNHSHTRKAVTKVRHAFPICSIISTSPKRSLASVTSWTLMRIG